MEGLVLPNAGRGKKIRCFEFPHGMEASLAVTGDFN